MAWADLTDDDVPNFADIEDAVATGALDYIGGVGPPAEAFASDDVWEDATYVSYVMGADAVGPAGSDDYPNKAEVAAWALPGSPANFTGTVDFGACPGSAITLSWTPSASQGVIIEHRYNNSGSWVQVANLAAGVSQHYDNVRADRTQLNNYRIRWTSGVGFSLFNRASWICPV